MGTWKSKNRHKYLLQYHTIFVCKYRKKLLVSQQISDDIKQFSYEICQRHKVIIKYMETDKDHIHYMIETEPTMSVSRIVNLMKSYTTHHIWERYPNYLRKHFWKEHRAGTARIYACGDSRSRGLWSRKPIGFRQWVVHGQWRSRQFQVVYIWWSKSQYQEEFTGREIFASLSGLFWKIKRGVGRRW